ncbi:MAG: PEGA domain-containing protein [Deltaproteobacteria bacterium]|nr:PEGA domain-containing protein [Deltaproteobacteria bacterium]
MKNGEVAGMDAFKKFNTKGNKFHFNNKSIILKRSERSTSWLFVVSLLAITMIPMFGSTTKYPYGRRCTNESHLAGEFRIVPSDGSKMGSCSPIYYDVIDAKGKKVFLLKSGCRYPNCFQVRQNTLLFWKSGAEFRITDLKTRCTRSIYRLDSHGFLVSPNGKQIAITNGAWLTIVNVATGKSQKVLSWHDKGREVPGWDEQARYGKTVVEILGWSDNGRDLWFLLHNDKTNEVGFVRYRDGKLRLFDFINHLERGLRLGTYYGKKYKTRDAFNPTRGWLLHIERIKKLPKSDLTRRNRGNYELLLTDLENRISISLGMPTNGDLGGSPPVWLNDNAFAYASDDTCYTIHDTQAYLPNNPLVNIGNSSSNEKEKDTRPRPESPKDKHVEPIDIRPTAPDCIPNDEPPPKPPPPDPKLKTHGYLSVHARPGSKIHINGKFGKWPQNKRHFLKAGNYKVKVVNSIYKIEKEFDVTIKVGETTNIKKALFDRPLE